jgi:hypothetical protein
LAGFQVAKPLFTVGCPKNAIRAKVERVSAKRLSKKSDARGGKNEASYCAFSWSCHSWRCRQHNPTGPRRFYLQRLILRRGRGLPDAPNSPPQEGGGTNSAKVIYGLQPLADAQWGLHSTGRRNRVRPWVCWERRRRHGCTRGYRRANALAPIHRLCAQGGIGIPRIPKPDLGTHTNEIEGPCSPWVFLRTNAPSAAVPQSDAFCQVPTFVTTGAPPGNRTIM